MNKMHRIFNRKTITILLPLFFFTSLNFTFSQCLITGADLSYVNKIEQNGGNYKDASGNVVNPFVLFADKGAKMIRLRLWHTPENGIDFCGNPINSSNLNDVLFAAQRIKSNGMRLNLSIHYSDNFVDPGKQLRPTAWIGLSQQVLLDSIYNYTFKVLEKLYLQNTLPDIVSIGNETTWGFIDESTPTNGFSWPEDAEKFNAGFNAVDYFNQSNNTIIKKALHFTESTAEWATNLFQSKGITNYDVIGISYYPKNSPSKTLQNIGQMISRLKNTYNREIMIFETGFIWTTNWADNYGNFIGNNGTALTYPISPQGQRDFLLDLASVVYENGGTGLLYWEPAWISSNMCDKWGRGSSYENASFFNFTNSNSALPAFDFFGFCKPLALENISKQEDVMIYPNPIQSNIIQITTEIPLDSWKIVNSEGQLINAGIFINFQKSYIITHKIGAKGVYFLLLTSNIQGIITKKLIL